MALVAELSRVPANEQLKRIRAHQVVTQYVQEGGDYDTIIPFPPGFTPLATVDGEEGELRNPNTWTAVRCGESGDVYFCDWGHPSATDTWHGPVPADKLHFVT